MRTTTIISTMLTLAFAVMLFSPVESYSQLLVNRGAQIHIREGAQVTVNGDTENGSGEIRVYNKARVTFNGNVKIVQGGLFLLQDCLASISMDLNIGIAGVCWRYAPGVLDVLGTIKNDGELNNEGEINIGKP
ncbi:MAG: hypothetical protein JSS89_06865 [Bacteroidetes bacterium]|nr:hypothetical protein [Bacteroidota bacterium]